MLAAAVSLVTLSACGDDATKEADDEVTACSCLKDAEALAKKMEEAVKSMDQEKIASLEKEGTDLKDKCKDFKEEDAKDCD